MAAPAYNYKNVYKYNKYGDVAECIMYSGSEKNWKETGSFKYKYKYSKGKMKSVERIRYDEDENTNKIVPTYKSVSKYDKYGSEIEYRYSTYNTRTKKWVFSSGSKYKITYKNKQIVRNEYSSYDSESKKWVKQSYSTSTYDKNGFSLTEEYYSYVDGVAQLDTKYKYKNSYNSKKELKERVTSVYNPETGKFEYENKTVDKNYKNAWEYRTYDYKGGKWVASGGFKRSFKTDSYGNFTEEKEYDYNNRKWDLRSGNQFKNTYKKKKLVKRVQKSYEPEYKRWSDYGYETFTYKKGKLTGSVHVYKEII